MHSRPLLLAALLATAPAYAQNLGWPACQEVKAGFESEVRSPTVALTAGQIEGLRAHLDGLMEKTRAAFPGYVFQPNPPESLSDGVKPLAGSMQSGVGTDYVEVMRRDYRGHWTVHRLCQQGTPLRSQFSLALKMAAPGTEAARQFEQERRNQERSRSVASLQDRQAQLGEKLGQAYARGDMDGAARLQEELMKLNEQTLSEVGQTTYPGSLEEVNQAIADDRALKARVARDVVELTINGGERDAQIGRSMTPRSATPAGAVALFSTPVYRGGADGDSQTGYLLLGGYERDAARGDFLNTDRDLDTLPPVQPQRSVMLTLIGGSIAVEAALKAVKAPAFGIAAQPVTVFQGSSADTSTENPVEKAGSAGKKVLDKAMGKLFGG